MAELSEPQTTGMWRVGTLANPTAFMRLSGKLLPWLIAIMLVLFAAGLTVAFRAPPDYQQGETVKIMYVHVPAAWLSMGCYTIIALSSAGYLIWRHPLADVSAKAAAPIGAVFTLLALVTGSLWGKPMWGAYWVWDARLTSVLILFFLYLGLIALREAIDEPGRAGRATAILALIGAVNIPIIKYSVNWWNTLHQPASVIRADGPTIAPSLLWPLLIMASAFTVLFVVLHLKAMRAEVLRRRCDAMIAVRVRGNAAQDSAAGEAMSHV
jgi:heme exporter protein C